MGFGVFPRKQVECIVTPLLWSTKNPLRGSTGRSHPGQFLALVSDITNPFLWEWMGAYLKKTVSGLTEPRPAERFKRKCGRPAVVASRRRHLISRSAPSGSGIDRKECRPLGRVARRPVWSCLSKREVSGNRRGCAGGVASVIDRGGQRVRELAAAGGTERSVKAADGGP